MAIKARYEAAEYKQGALGAQQATPREEKLQASPSSSERFIRYKQLG